MVKDFPEAADNEGVECTVVVAECSPRDNNDNNDDDDWRQTARRRQRKTDKGHRGRPRPRRRQLRGTNLYR